MTNPFLQKIAAAIKDAKEKAPYHVRFHVNDNTWEVWDNSNDPTAIIVNASHEEAESLCEEQINLYIAQKAVEAMRGNVPYYETDKMWKELHSQEVWNLCLDHILK